MAYNFENRTTSNDKGLALAILIGALLLNLPPKIPDSILGFIALASTIGWVSRNNRFGGLARTIGNCLGGACGATVMVGSMNIMLASSSASLDPESAWMAELLKPAAATAIVSILCGLDLITCTYMKTDITGRIAQWIQNRLSGGGE